MASTLRRAYLLEFATIGWNAAEAIVALNFGLRAGSIVLTAFGFDSVIEVFSAVVVLFELRGHSGQDAHKKAERRTLQLIGGGFFLLAAYVVINAAWDLLHRSRPDHSIPGIVLTSASLATMWLLAAAKHREGHRIDCLPLIADSRETRLCSLLSAVALAGFLMDGSL